MQESMKCFCVFLCEKAELFHLILMLILLLCLTAPTLLLGKFVFYVHSHWG